MFFDFGVEGGAVVDGTIDGARVDEIEGFFTEGPWFCEIVDLEVELGRHVGG